MPLAVKEAWPVVRQGDVGVAPIASIAHDAPGSPLKYKPKEISRHFIWETCKDVCNVICDGRSSRQAG